MLLAHRGLRVRMGINTGHCLVSHNAASARFTFSGDVLQLTKAVADAAHGGQVLLSQVSSA